MTSMEQDMQTGQSQSYLDSVAAASLRRPLVVAVRWGAILAGVAAGVSVQLVLTLFGIATGLNTLAAAGSGAAMGALLWAGASMLVAAYVGGYVAARMSGLKRKADGVLHGLVSWAVTTLLFATLAATAGGAMLGGIFNAMGPGTPGAVRAGAPVADMLRTEVDRIDLNSLQLLQQHIEAGRREEAIDLLVNSMGLVPARAARVVDQALILSGAPANGTPQPGAEAERVVQNAGATAWVLFAAVALALAVGVAGGVVGAISARRTTWSSSSFSSAT